MRSASSRGRASGSFTAGFGGRAEWVAGDVREEAFAQALVEVATGRFGRLDIAVNNAGAFGGMGPTHEISAEGWREAVDVNLTGAFFGAKHQVPAMLARGGGSLLFTSTFVGHTVGFPGVAAYAASKSGVNLPKNPSASTISANAVSRSEALTTVSSGAASRTRSRRGVSTAGKISSFGMTGPQLVALLFATSRRTRLPGLREVACVVRLKRRTAVRPGQTAEFRRRTWQ